MRTHWGRHSHELARNHMKRNIPDRITRCSALLILGATGTLWAQTNPEASGTALVPHTQVEEPATSQYIRRVLRLKNGSFVRTACSLQDGQWVLGRKASAKSIPAMFVESVVREKDLLKDLKKQAAASAPGTLPAWCLQHGLLKEGLTQLDKDLDSHGSRQEALATLEQYERFLPTLPEVGEDQDPEQIFDQYASWLSNKNTASLHELAARSIAQTALAQTHTLAPDEAAPWDECLTRVLTGNKAKRRSLALSTLAHWKGTRSAKILRRFAMLDRTEGTRDHAAWLLGTLQDPEQVSGLIAWLDHDHAEIRMRAGSALGFSGYPAAVPALVAALGSGGSGARRRIPHANVFIGSQTAYVQDFDVEVASGSAVADPIINVLPTGVVLDAGVVSIAVHRQRTVYRKALNRITGHRAGNSVKSWSQWLSKYPTVNTEWRAPWPTPQ